MSNIASSKSTDDQSVSISVVLIGIILGLVMNWLALYLNIVLGLLSIGISSFVVLLFTRIVLRERATKRNLSLVSIAYGATSAAEASVGLLFLLWLSENASSFSLDFNPPSWLLPSSEIIANRLIFSVEWIIPLLIHYFLMLIPGISGLILGIYLAPKFLHNDEEYPFPGTIQAVKTVEVLVTNQKSKVQLFKRFLFLGFIIAFVTLLIPVIDFSQVSTGMIFGIMLGTIGVTMFAVGIVVNNPKITVPAGIASIAFYSILSPMLIDIADFQSKVALGIVSNDFYGIYSYLLQNTFLSFIIGFLLSAALLNPIFWRLLRNLYHKIKPIKSKNSDAEASFNQVESKEVEIDVSQNEKTNSQLSLFQKLISKLKITKRELVLSGVYVGVLVISTLFVVLLDILPGVEFEVAFLLLIWILLLASVIQGYITASTIAKSSTAIGLPFIFDNIPIFLTGARGLLPYIATPKAEIGETIHIITTLKFGQQMRIRQKHTLSAFLAGYLVAALITPFFALFLWNALGIGTVNFPAPGFPITLAMIGPFAAGAIEVFFNIGELILGAGAALFFPGIGISIAIGLFLPPHMAICLSSGGILAIFLQKHYGKEWMDDKGKIIATALSVGATFTVPLLILINLIS